MHLKSYVRKILVMLANVSVEKTCEFKEKSPVCKNHMHNAFSHCFFTFYHVLYKVKA